MARNISTTVFSNYTISGGATGLSDIYLEDLDNVQFLLDMTYAATSSVTGVQIRLYAGFGNVKASEPYLYTDVPVQYALSPGACSLNDPFNGVSDNYELVADVPTFTPSSGSSQTKRLSFYLNNCKERWPRWCRIKYINLDASNPVTLKLRADL